MQKKRTGSWLVSLLPLLAPIVACSTFTEVPDTSDGRSEPAAGEGASGSDAAPSPAVAAEGGAAVDGPAAGARYVFVTSTPFSGDLTGADFADVRCQAEADAAHLLGKYVAWIATPTTPPEGRVVSPVGSPTFVTTMGELVFPAGNLPGPGATPVHPIRWDASKKLVASDAFVWTGTPSGGAASETATTCAEWTSADLESYGWVGDPLSTTSSWTSLNTHTCKQTGRLYCFQTD